MLLKEKFNADSTRIRKVRPFVWLIYTSVIVIGYQEFNLNMSVPISIPSILGSAIALFLAFRTNSAYQRWWEARQIWGEIVNSSRTLARQALLFGDGKKSCATREAIIKRQIAWCWILANCMRDKDWQSEGVKYIDEKEKLELKEKSHIPNMILVNQAQAFKALEDENAIDKFDFRRVDNTLKNLSDAMGKSERIKNTVFPTQYSLFTRRFIDLFLLLLPFSLASSIGYYGIIVHTAIGFTFGIIQGIADSLQNPFENKPNDIAIFSISRTIERNLLEMLNEPDLPEIFPSKNDVLM